MVIKGNKKHSIGKVKGSPGMKAQTPQPQKKGGLVTKKKTPKSEPHPKRKKLSEELSDEEFEEITNIVKEQEKIKKKLGKNTPKPKSPEKDPSDEFGSDDDDDDDLDLSDLEFDSDDDDDDSDELLDSDDEGDQQQNSAGKKKLAKKFKSMMENADSDSEEESDDEEDEDSSENEDSAPPAKKIKQQESAKKNKQQKETVVGSEGAKNKKRKADDSPAVNGKQQKVSATQLASDASAIDERDRRTIFLNGLPISTTDEAIKELFKKSLRKSIVDVRRKRIKKNVHAYVEFQNKEQAQLGHESVKGKKMGDQDIKVDFVGKASLNKPLQKKMDPDDFDPLRLYITGFNKSTTLAQVQQLFKGATKVQVPTRKKSKKSVGYAFAHYKTEAECKKVHDSMNGTMFKDRPLVVLFAKKTTEEKKSDKRPELLEAKVEAKKRKLEQKKKAKDESSDESDEEDDDEEDEDDDNDDDDENESDDDEENESDNDDEGDDNDDSDEDTGSE